MGTEDVSGSRVAREDVELIIGVLADLDGELLSGNVSVECAADVARRFVGSQRLELADDGALPSVGEVARAMSQLIDRLRFSLGEHEHEPGPSPEGTAHVVDFHSKGAATACRELLALDATETFLEPAGGTRGWRLYIVYPELSPDTGFHRREQTLTTLTARYGGTYKGSQGALPSR